MITQRPMLPAWPVGRFALFFLMSCALVSAQVNPDTAQKASIDRFSAKAGHLFVRDASNGLPDPNEPIDFDHGPFFTKGFGPDGERIGYYNFDVQSTDPAPIYVLFKQGESSPVQGQLNIVDVVPGDSGYNDMWQVVKVTVPSNYAANTVTSFEEIKNAGYAMEKTDMLVNCPIVPDGSIAKKRWNGSDFGLTRGWYKNKVVFYFNFFEKAITTDANGMVPLSPIYVSFNINPDQIGGGPPSGFKVDTITGRTHNVAATIPTDAAYSPYWLVNIYDNADFDSVHDLASAQSANIMAAGAAIVNCPVVAQYTAVDRFSASAGHLFVRDSVNMLPGPNMPVNFDMEPFYSKGLGPKGELISYYNFDVQPTEPAPIFVIINTQTNSPFSDQHNIIDVIPGDSGYSDFWQVYKVMVPGDYVPNSITSYDQLINANYPMQKTDILVNCPVVSEGSTAEKRLNGESPALTEGWYKNKIVYYFTFSEKALTTDANGMVPLSPIFVSFNINPGQPGGGAPSGFMTDSTGRAHNVVATLPRDDAYSPLWLVNVYDNADFNKVHDLTSAESANILVTGAGNVNCPVVTLGSMTAVTDNNSSLPDKYSLQQNYPNPFNPSTVISYNLPVSGKVVLKIYDVLGNEVATLVNNIQAAGSHQVEFNTQQTTNHQQLSSGVYFYTLRAANFVESKKMVLLK